MSIFGGLSTPKWMSPDEQSQWSTDQGNTLAKIWTQKNQYNQERADQQAMIQRQLQAAQVVNAKQRQAADWLHASGDDGNPIRPWEVVSNHPELLLDPATAKGTSEVLKSSFDASRIQSNSTEAKIALQQTTDFTKQLNALNSDDPAAVASIRGMSKAKDGSPTAMQWQALSLAQQRIKVQKDLAIQQAEDDARARGDNVTISTGPKGETITARTPPPAKNAASSNVEPQIKTFPDGTSVIFNPKGGGFHVLQKDGQTKPMSTSEMSRLFTSTAVDEEWKKSLGDELKKRSGTGGPLPLPSQSSDLKKGSKYTTARGVATWDGSKFVQ